MKKIILILLLLITGCSKEEIKPLKQLGYTDEEISVIETMNIENVNYIENISYNENYINLINHENFNENNLKNYVSMINNNMISLDDIIFIVNNNYYDPNINYNDHTLSYMKSNYYIHDNLEKYLDYENKITEVFETNQEKINYVITSINSKVDNKFYTNTIPTDLSKGYLILVNKYNYLSSDYVPNNLVTISYPYGASLQVEKTAYEAFINMYNDAKSIGLNLYITSPYRSYNTQLGLYNRYVREDGQTLADTYSARAGHSEHQTGLALDIIIPGGTLGGFEYTSEFKWLKDNAHKYGFILRYPFGKEWITGYDYEPWHYRYVGVDVATKVYNEDITFEEYYAYYIEKSSN